MKNLFHLFFLVGVLVLTKFCPCLSQQIFFNRVSPPFGSFDGVGGIAQDKNGYMWFATARGLYRYDGYSFKRYINNPSDSNSLSATHLETLYIDREGMIWIAAWFNGLNRLDPATGKFTRFNHNATDPGSLCSDTVRAILEDKEGVLWVGTLRGLDRYDRKTGKFRRYSHDEDDPNSLSCDRVRALYEDKEGTLWVGTGSSWSGEGNETDEGGLNRFDRATGNFFRYLNKPNDPHSLINNKVQAIFEDSKGNFWIGTAGDGLHKMDRKTGTFERYQYDPAHPDKLSRPPINVKAGYDHIAFITEDALGNLWIGTAANGLSRYDPKTQRNTYYNRDSSGFEDEGGWSVCNSRDGILWIGVLAGGGGGLYRIDPYHKNITHVSTPASVLSFNEDPAGSLWIGTTQGLLWRESKAGIIKQFFYRADDPKSLSNGPVIVLSRDDNGILWIGTGGGGAGEGLNRFNAHANNFTRYLNKPNDNNTIAGEANAIVRGGGDSLWIGTVNGVDLMNKRTGVFTHFKDTKDTSLGAINSMLKDRSGNLLIGASGGAGLSYFNHTTGTFSRFLKGLEIYSLLVASDGTTWVGTDVGVYLTNDIHHGFTRFACLGSDKIQYVLAIQEDSQKKIWLSTSSGIFRIDPVSNLTNFYGDNYGVKGSDLTCSRGLRGRDGKIYFGDKNGYYVFAPTQLTSNATPPQIILTGFSLGGTSVQPGEKNVFTSSLENRKEVSLKYNQNAFTIAFAAIHYSSPENNRHLYMLEHYDQTWLEAGVNKTASYFNVPPGHYIFHIKAASSDGVWAERAVEITITPPWWNTWWAYVLYALLAVAGVLAIVYFHSRTLRRELEQRKNEQQLVELRHQKSELEMQALRAQMNPHFIFNSLNSINRFILLKNSAQASDYLTKFSRLMRLILQNSQASLISLESELESLELYLSLEVLRFDYHFNYKVFVAEDVDTSELKVPPLIVQPYAENAIWHGLMHKEEKGQLDIEVSREGDFICVKVIDNGIGRKKASEVASKSATRHKSMGLKITADRIAMMGHANSNESVITINDLVDPDGRAAGTEVIIKIPAIHD